MSVTIDDGLLSPAQSVLVYLAGGRILVNFKTPGLGLPLHELLGLDELADLLQEEVVYQHGVCSRDYFSEPGDDFLDRLTRFRDMGVGFRRLSGVEFLARIREFIASVYHLLGAKSP